MTHKLKTAFEIRARLFTFIDTRHHMPHISTRTDDVTKAAFKAVAKKRRKTESKLLDEFVASVIGASQAIEEVAMEEPGSVEPSAVGAELGRLNIRPPAFILDGIKERAKWKEMSANRWVVALLQSHLTGKPVVTDYEIAALKSSARELAAIGRNLNQIARALNESFHETDRVKLELLKDLATEIKVNRQAIRNLVRASLNSWGVSA